MTGLKYRDVLRAFVLQDHVLPVPYDRIESIDSPPIIFCQGSFSPYEIEHRTAEAVGEILDTLAFWLSITYSSSSSSCEFVWERLAIYNLLVLRDVYSTIAIDHLGGKGHV